MLRQVRRTLFELRRRYEGRGAALTEHGVYLIAHTVFKLLDTESMGEPDVELAWAENATGRTKELVRRLVPVTAGAIDQLFTERSQIRAVCSDVARARELADHVVRAMTSPRGAGAPDTYRRVRPQRKRRRPNAVSVLVDKGVLADGTPLVLSSAYPLEAAALGDWLAEDGRRALASWVNHRTKPILWAADGERYSPSGLITHMWELAGWAERPVANQGTARWTTKDGTTLADLAWGP
ncbi:hypothetical protein [Streptomyces sp. I6]|uniref:hypothetical protein n=1 Tax=Streptomyces sp. I6 TaxID=2483113 RepID=UPI0028802BFD|nr:hypothetical protein [Streptomyces sp. I6]